MEEEWEVLSSDGFHDRFTETAKTAPKIMIDANYFVCPSSPPKSRKLTSEYLLQLPIEPSKHADPQSSKEVSTLPLEVTLLTPLIVPKPKDLPINPSLITDHDPVSQLSFKKMKENEFVDMKLDSPPRPLTPTKLGFLPPDPIESESCKCDDCELKIESKMNFWKWSLTGVGAICSFGVVAAATICIIILGSDQKNCDRRSDERNLRAQFYADEKGVKHVVDQTTKSNEAISITRSLPVSRVI